MTVTQSIHIHAPGILSLTSDRSNTDKESIFACSSDETFCTWKCSTGKFLEEIQNCLGNCQGVLAIFGEDIYIGEARHDSITNSHKQIVAKYSRSTFISSAPLLTFPLEVTALDCSKNWIVAGSNDFVVKCLNLNTPDKTYDRYEFDQVIVNLSISPNEEFFAISTADGFVQIRTTKKLQGYSSKKSLAKFKAVMAFKNISFDSPRMQCAWSLKSTRLFIPEKSKIAVVSTEYWKEEKSVDHPNLKNETFSIVSFSADNKYLVGCTLEGTVAVWGFDYDSFPLTFLKKKVAQSIGTITSALFNPAEDDCLILGYSEGYLCSVTGVISESLIVEKTQRNGVNKKSRDDDEIIDENEDRQNIEAEDNDMEVGLDAIKSQYGFDSFGVHISERAKDKDFEIRELHNKLLEQPACTTVKGMKTPETFAVSSTPIHSSQRFLVWNMFGAIKCYRTGEDSSIEISFHDTSIHPEILIDNTDNNYIIGDLNSNLVGLASKKNSSKESELLVYHLNAWDIDSRQWIQKMSEFEIIECLCVGLNFVAVFTSQRYLRVFTITGAQRIISSLPGPLLTMCSSKCELVTVQATGGVIVHSDDDYEHRITANIYEIDVIAPGIVMNLVKSIPLALGAEVNSSMPLRWISHSQNGQIVTMDSEFTVRLFNAARSMWFPIVVGSELLKDPEVDSLWPIGVTEVPSPSFRYAYCRGSKYPSTDRPVVLLTAPWSFPVLNNDSERGKHENDLLTIELQQTILRFQQHLQHDPSVQQQLNKLSQLYLTNLLKLFAISCQSGKECRAAELTHRALTEQGIQAMCSYASKKQRNVLSEKRADESGFMNQEPKFLQSNDSSFHPVIRDQISSRMPQTSTIDNPIQISRKVVLPRRKAFEKKNEVDIVHIPKESEERDCESRLSNVLNNSSLGNSSAFSLNESAINMYSNPADNTSMFINESLLSDKNSPANNPFKRSKIKTVETSSTDTIDIFDTISAKSLESLPIASTAAKRKNIRNKGEKEEKSKQSTLFSFASSTISSSAMCEENSKKQSIPEDANLDEDE